MGWLSQQLGHDAGCVQAVRLENILTKISVRETQFILSDICHDSTSNLFNRHGEDDQMRRFPNS